MYVCMRMHYLLHYKLPMRLLSGFQWADPRRALGITHPGHKYEWLTLHINTYIHTLHAYLLSPSLVVDVIVVVVSDVVHRTVIVTTVVDQPVTPLGTLPHGLHHSCMYVCMYGETFELSYTLKNLCTCMYLCMYTLMSGVPIGYWFD